MTVVLAVDLAVRAYSVIGIALLRSIHSSITVRLVAPTSLGLADPPQAAELAEALARLAEENGASLIAIDGPQAWKAPHNGLEHARLCERALHTQAKTGLPGVAKPGPSLRFVEFSISLFDHLAEQGWPRFTGEISLSPPPGVAIEVYPTAAWRALGRKPLPAKNAQSADQVQQWLPQLQAQSALTVDRSPSHDELQAIMAGLVGLALTTGDCQLHGAPPFLLEGQWREGYIVNLKSHTER